MGRVAGVFDNPPGFPCTPPGVDILEGGKLTSNNVAGSSHDPLQSPTVASGAVSKPGGDTAGQDALHSAGVEGSEDSGARSKLPQPSQEEETLMCLLQHCICVSRPCEILSDVNAEELKAAHPLHRCLVDGDGCVFSALSPVIHHQLLFQQDLAPAHTAKSTKSWLNDHGVGVLDWPANSPDLNPIENLWGIVKRKKRNKRPKNANELKATVKETWASIPPQ